MEAPASASASASASEISVPSPWTFDLLISAFLQALHSHRRASICTPFPSSLFSEHGEKDYDAALAATVHIASIRTECYRMESTTSDESVDIRNPFSILPERSLKLVDWLLKFRYDVQLVTDPTLELPKMISDKLYGSHGFTASQRGLIPNYILKLQESGVNVCRAFDGNKLKCGSIFAFHGTSAENLHSILRCGLLVLSNSNLQQNGAIFGEGIYLSSDPAVALGFCKAGKGWEHSSFGQNARFLLLCEVAKGDKVIYSDISDYGTSKSNKCGKGLGTYIVVQNSDLVKLRYIFVYVNSFVTPHMRELHPVQSIPRLIFGGSVLSNINWFKVVIGSYVMLLLGIAYLDTSKFQNSIRRYSKRP